MERTAGHRSACWERLGIGRQNQFNIFCVWGLTEGPFDGGSMQHHIQGTGIPVVGERGAVLPDFLGNTIGPFNGRVVLHIHAFLLALSHHVDDRSGDSVPGAR